MSTIDDPANAILDYKLCRTNCRFLISDCHLVPTTDCGQQSEVCRLPLLPFQADRQADIWDTYSCVTSACLSVCLSVQLPACLPVEDRRTAIHTVYGVSVVPVSK
jgi:hypothetical protein